MHGSLLRLALAGVEAPARTRCEKPGHALAGQLEHQSSAPGYSEHPPVDLQRFGAEAPPARSERHAVRTRKRIRDSGEARSQAVGCSGIAHRRVGCVDSNAGVPEAASAGDPDLPTRSAARSPSRAARKRSSTPRQHMPSPSTATQDTPELLEMLRGALQDAEPALA